MLKIKLIILAMSMLGAGAYVVHLRNENQTLIANEIANELALDQAQQRIELIEKNQLIKDRQLETRRKQMSNLVTLNNKLKGELNEISKHDPVLVGCLDTIPGGDYINRLLDATKGQTGN